MHKCNPWPVKLSNILSYLVKLPISATETIIAFPRTSLNAILQFALIALFYIIECNGYECNISVYFFFYWRVAFDSKDMQHFVF